MTARIVMVTLALLVSSVSLADQPDLEAARVAYQAGAKSYERGEYADALRWFEQSYELSKRPTLLFNMALCDEKLGRDAEALRLLVRYRENASPGERADVERRIAALEARVRTGPTPPSPPANTRPRRVASWALLGVTGALAVTSIGLGGASYTRYAELRDGCSATGAPGCAQGEVDDVRRMALATDVLIGVTAAAAIVTTVVFVLEPRLRKRVERVAWLSAGVRIGFD